MDISVTKLELIDLLLKTNKENVLNKIRAILKDESDSDIVGYSVVGEPFDFNGYNKKLQKAEDDFASGKVISHENIKKKYSK